MTSTAARPRPPALAGAIEVTRLANGLEVCLVRNRQAPLVASAIFYRVGCRDEEFGRGGLAHFLEHLMFKGSERYGPGAIDSLTQALGGSNNAFTSHDVTAYWFVFASDRWEEALAIEADRMRGLRLDPEQIDAERRVILEEIAMYRDEPWDALEMDVQAALWPAFPYGRPILGTAEELAAQDRDVIAAFHRRYYRPGNATLVLAGDVDDRALERVEAAFGQLRGGELPRPTTDTLLPVSSARRIERRHGDVARLLIALPVPPPDDPAHAGLRILATVLSEGRGSRLERRLVDEDELCISVSASVSDHQLAAHFAIAAEMVPGADPGRVEAVVLEELRDLAARPIDTAELERARQVFLADWAWGQERIYQQAVAAGLALAMFDLGQPARLLDAALAAEPPALRQLAGRYLEPTRGSVTGLSLPED